MRVSSTSRSLFFSLSALLTAGCAGGEVAPGQTPTTVASANGPLGANGLSANGRLIAREKPPAPQAKYLYVSDTSANAVTVFDPATGATLSSITSGLAGPYGLAFDKFGNLYVANSGGGNVTVYALNATTPSRTLVDSGQTPIDVTVRSDGTAYVTNIGGNVAVYPPGANSPSYTLTNSNLLRCYGVALDRSGSVYVSGRDGGDASHVVKFKKNKVTGADLGLTGLTLAYGLVLDNLGNLVVVDTLAPDVAIYAAGATSPFVVFGNTGQPSFVAFDKPRRNVYVGDLFGDDVAVYQYPSGAFVRTIPDLNGATTTGVAVYPPALL